jgi:hypothetical protein
VVPAVEDVLVPGVHPWASAAVRLPDKETQEPGHFGMLQTQVAVAVDLDLQDHKELPQVVAQVVQEHLIRLVE